MGAGYSGLRQITTLRPSYLKLDRSLISGIDSDPDRGALVAAMLGYARQTGGHLVAEGVETEAELETLPRPRRRARAGLLPGPAGLAVAGGAQSACGAIGVAAREVSAITTRAAGRSPAAGRIPAAGRTSAAGPMPAPRR